MSPKEARQAATSALATMMGAIVLARAVGDKDMSDDILAAGQQALRRRAAARKCAHREVDMTGTWHKTACNLCYVNCGIEVPGQ